MRSLIVIAIALVTTAPALAQKPDPQPSRLAQLLQPAPPKTGRLAQLQRPAPVDPLQALGSLTRCLHFGVSIASAALIRDHGGASEARAAGQRWLAALPHLAGLSPDVRRLAESVTRALAQGDDADVASLMMPRTSSVADEQLVLGIWIGIAHFGTNLPDETRRALSASGAALASRPGLDAVQQDALRRAASALGRGDDQALASAVDVLIDHLR